MSRQTLEIRRDGAVVLETAHGVISIRRLTENGNKVVLELPDDLKAHRSAERMREDAKFLKFDESGHVTPTFQILVPRLDTHGHLAGISVPQRVRLRSQNHAGHQPQEAAG